MSQLTQVEEREDTNKITLGFWVYLMTDCVLFATLFATYLVLHSNTNGGPSSTELFHLPYVLIETLLLLTSSFTVGIALLAARHGYIRRAVIWLITTAILGAAFLAMEVTEFAKLAHDGSSWSQSAFTSSYFTLVGTHGLHITAGLIWLVILLGFMYKRGANKTTIKRLSLFSLFWHFLDIVWIFIFSVVYLMGAL